MFAHTLNIAEISAFPAIKYLQLRYYKSLCVIPND